MRAMRRSPVFIFAVILGSVGALSSCVTTRSYVDPQYHKAGYDSIHRLTAPIPVKLSVQFQRNGQPLPAVDNELRGYVVHTLLATGVLSPTDDANAAISFNITANNIADLAAAQAKGFKTGITFGASGSVIDDNYEFSFSYRDAGNQQYQTVYQHAIHSTVGNAASPAGLTPTTPDKAFGVVVEDVVLNFIQELQEKGIIQD